MKSVFVIRPRNQGSSEALISILKNANQTTNYFLHCCFPIFSRLQNYGSKLPIFSKYERTKGDYCFFWEITQKASLLLKTYLDQAFDNPFLIQNNKSENAENSKIILEVNKESVSKNDSFSIKSDEKNIYLIGSSEKTLRYAIYTLLEYSKTYFKLYKL